MCCSADIAMGEMKDVSDEEDGEEESREKQRICRHVVQLILNERRKQRSIFKDKQKTELFLKISRQKPTP